MASPRVTPNAAPAALPKKRLAATLEQWEPENAAFWELTGKQIANRNLVVSIPCLLTAFSVWSFWSVITVQMGNLGFPFSAEQLFMISAVAGLTGATLRIPNSFVVSMTGGRNAVAVGTLLLLAPALGTGIALQDRNTPFVTFLILAALSGFGGGNFAASMSNISRFFPRKSQGLALGLNAGFGNLGVSLMQFLLPMAMTMPIFSSWGGAGLSAPRLSAQGNTAVWIQNAGFVWVPVTLALTIAAWFGMNNLPSRELANTPRGVGRFLALNLAGLLAAAAGIGLLFVFKLSPWIVLPLTVVLALFLTRAVPVGQGLESGYEIFSSKHNWIMTWLYVMTFGSFIGYSMAFPLLIRVVFGTMPDGSPNPAAPNPFTYAWLGPLVGSLLRPVGGWMSDRWGGARVTQWSTALMVVAALGAAYWIRLATNAASPEQYFLPFLLLFLLLFLTAGIGNGSTFRMIPIIFDKQQAGPVLGWTSAVGAYGAFIIPVVIGGQVRAGHPESAFYGFAAYYVISLALNWWFYARRNAEIAC